MFNFELKNKFLDPAEKSLLFTISGYAYLTSRSSIQPFICEICDPSIRGTTSTLWALFFSSGIGLSILASNQLGWRYVSGFFAALMVACFLSLLWIHETPDWLLEKRRFEDAIKALEFYRIDPKILVHDDDRRVSKDGEDKNYRKLVMMYRKASVKPRQPLGDKNNNTDQSWR